MPMTDQVVRHVYGGTPEPVKIKVEKNSRGFNWEVAITGATVSDVLTSIDYAVEQLKERFEQDGV